MHGLTESGDRCNDTLRTHILKDSDMNGTIGDQSLLFERASDRSIGLSGYCVVDILRVATNNFFENYESVTKKCLRLEIQSDMCSNLQVFLFHEPKTTMETRTKKGSKSCYFCQRRLLIWSAGQYVERHYSSWSNRCCFFFVSNYKDHNFQQHCELVDENIWHLEDSPKMGLYFPKQNLGIWYPLMYPGASINLKTKYRVWIGFMLVFINDRSLGASYNSFLRKHIDLHVSILLEKLYLWKPLSATNYSLP